MAFIDTGHRRATTLTITVILNGVAQSSNIFPFMSAFTYNSVTYPAVNAVVLQQMELELYEARASAYAAYVQSNYQSQYPGLVVSSAGSRI